MGSKHKPNLSQSSTSSSENDAASRASSSSHAPASASQQQTMSRWERLRRPSAASSTKRPNFSDASRSNSTHSSTVTSPTTPFFPLPSPIGGPPSQDMLRTASDDSYMHILAASAAARRAAMESGAAASAAASLMSFTCSLSKEFDRQRTDVDSLNASLVDLPASAGSASRGKPQPESLEKKQAWLDTTFNKLSARYRTPKKGPNQKGGAARPAKPHFLDLSSIICPTPAPADPNASTEDEGEAGDRSSSSSSSFNSGPDSSFEAMSGWDNSSADTSLELRTPQNEEDRQLACSAYDFTTPRPSQMQRFASAQSAATSHGSDMRLPSPPLISPLMPNFALPTSGASTPGLGPSPATGNYGFPAPPIMVRGVTVDDIHHKPSSVAVHPVGTMGLAPPGPPAGIRQLRKQKSFDNPAELRRRQKQEWSVGGPKPPGFGGNPKLTIGIPKASHFQQPSQGGLLSPQHALSPQSMMHPLDPRRQRAPSQVRSPTSNHAILPGQAPLHSRVAEMQRPSAMQRGLSHDTAGASLQHHTAAASGSLSPPQRPGLVPRASSGALRSMDSMRMGTAPAMSDIDPASSTGFSTSSRQLYGRPGSDRRMPVQLPVTSPLQSPIGGSVPLPPLMAASSRESYGSSVGTESLPPTPMSATFLRGLPMTDERVKLTPSSPRDVRAPRDLQHLQHHPGAFQSHGAAPMMGSALGLVPGKMVRAYSENAYAFPSEEVSRVRTGSRLRGESISSQDDGGDERDGAMRRNAYATQTTPRQKVRPELRREHTSNAIMVSPPKPKAQPLDGRPEYLGGSPKAILAAPLGELARPGSAASATITPRSSSLKDLLAVELQGDDQREERTPSAARASLDSDCSDSSLAYTKPSPLIPQGVQASAHASASTRGDATSSNSNNITPTNSYRTDLAARGIAPPTAANGGPISQWSPDNSPAAKPTAATAFQGARQRANSRADEWAANLRKLTTRGGANNALPAAAAK